MNKSDYSRLLALFRRQAIQAQGAGRRRARKSVHGQAPATQRIAMEPRMLFDGAVAATADAMVNEAERASDGAGAPAIRHEQLPLPRESTFELPAFDTAEAAEPAALSASVRTDESPSEEPSLPAEGGESQTLVFIDNRITDQQAFVDAAPEGARIITLDTDQSGIAQILQAVEGERDIGAIHLISHGEAGRLYLGSSVLTQATIEGPYQAALNSLGGSLTTDADLLIYGCNFGEGELGLSAADALAAATGADVAASTDLTGAQALGGDWDLELHRGEIETDAIEVFSFDKVLAPITISVTTPPVVTAPAGTTTQPATLYTNHTGTRVLPGAGSIVGTTALWSNAGLLGAQSLDIRATVTAADADDFVQFSSRSPATAIDDDPTLLVGDNSPVGVNANTDTAVRVLWEIFLAGTNTPAAGEFGYLITDVDGIGGNTDTREAVAASVNDPVSYTLNTTTDLVGSIQGDLLRVDGTQDSADQNQIRAWVQFNWVNSSSFELNYYLLANNGVTFQAGFSHDGDGDKTFTGGGVTASIPKLDLDLSASGNDYNTTFTEGGSAVSIADTDIEISNSPAAIDGATVTLTNRLAGDSLTVGTLPSGITATVDTSDPNAIVVNLIGSTTPANYETAIRSISYSNNLQAPDTTNRVVNAQLFNSLTAGNNAQTTIAVQAVNDAPVNTVPGAQTFDEDTSRVFSSANGNAISVADVDALGANLTVTLSVPQGSLTLGGTSGVSVSGNGSGTVQVTGSAANLNVALNGLTYAPVTNQNGDINLTVVTSDNGNTGSGGALNDSDTVLLSIQPVNDAPVAGNESRSVAEDGVRTFDPHSNDSDVDGDSLIVTQVDGNAITAGGASVGVSNGSVRLLSDGRLRFIPDADYNGTSSFTYTVSDGNGGFDVATATMNVSAVNDAPVHALPANQTIAEDSSLVFSTANGNPISLSDVDAGASNLTTTLSVAQGSLSLAGTSGLTVNGNNSGTVVMTGTATSINDALNGLTYTPVTNQNGTVALNLVTSDNGNTGSGGTLTDSDSVNINITAVNDAPVNTVPGVTQNISEDSLLVLSAANGNALTISDVDAGTSNLTVIISAPHGSLTLGSTSGVTTSGNGSASITVTGNQTDINAALNGLTYAPGANQTGLVSLSMQTSDNGNTGSGGPLTDNSVVNVQINAVNDSPVNTVPGTQVFAEDTTLTISSGNGNAISVADVDAATSPVTVTLSVPSGALSLATTSGLSVSGDGSASVTLSGATGAINTALNGLTYTPEPNQNGSVALSVATTDNGNTGSGGALTTNSSVTLQITAVNDAPVNSVPGSQSLPEDGSLTFSTGNSNAMSVADVDAGSADLTVSLNVSQGSLALAGTSGLTVSGNTTASVLLTGSRTDINTALDGLVYNPAPNQNGSATLTMVTNDNGNTGGPALTDTSTVSLQVVAINDAPLNSVPGAQSTNEDTALTFSGSGGNAISVNDVDADAGNLTMTLSVPQGSLSLGSTVGVTTSGNNSGTVVVSGTQANLNAALDGLSYNPDLNQNGTVLLSVSTSDNGNTGSGGVLIDTDTVSIQVNAVNDAPVNAMPAGQAIDEDSTLTFSVANGNSMSVSDADAGSGALTVTLSVPQGALTLSGTSGLSVTGNGSSLVTLNGNASDINTALDGLIFAPALNQNGPVPLTMSSNDNGNTGGPALTATNSVTIQINAINDAPNAVVPAPQSTAEDTALVFSTGNGNAISVADADAGSDNLTVTLGVPAGDLTLAGTAGLTITGNGTGAVSLAGSQNAINAALNGLSYQPGANQNGSLSLSLSVSDNANNGSGGVLTDNGSVLISVSAVNDAPVNTVPAAQLIDEDTSLVFSAGNGNGISITDIDAGTANVTVTLDVDRGSLTLGSTSGLTVTGNSTGSVELTGSQGDINTALEGLTFTPVSNDDNDATLTLVTSDGGNTGSGGALSSTSTVAIQVNPINDAPLASDDSLTTAEGVAGNLDVRSNDTDADSDPLFVSQINGSPISIGSSVAVPNGSVTLQADGSLTFLPTGDFNGPASFDYTIADGNGGNSTGTVNISVTAVNDAPVHVVPGSQSIPEDGSITFTSANGNGISLSDVDAGTADLTVTLSVGQGSLTLGSTSNLLVSGDASQTVVMTGALADLNAALDGLTYTSAPNQNGSVILGLSTSDNGNSGSGGPLSSSSNISINIGAVNDAPIQTVPGLQTFSEDNTLTFSAANGNAIGVSDVDAGAGNVTTTLSIAQGSLTLGNTAGLTVTGDGSSTITMTGTTAAITSAMDGLVFTPDTNQNGALTLAVSTNDNGNTGSGPAQSVSDTIAIQVLAVNDAPSHSVPGAQSLPEDAALTFSVANGNAISVTDPDSGGADLTMTLNASQGTLALGSSAGVTATGDGSATVVLTGSQTNLNAALDGLTYTPIPNQNGTASLSISTSDNGNTGSGGVLVDTDTVTIQVNAVNDAPVNTIPLTQTVNEDNTLTLSLANGNALSVNDVDAGSGDLTVTLSVPQGNLNLSGTSGLIVSGNGSSSLTVTGNTSDINSALDGLVFAPTLNQNGPVSLTMVSNDNGNTGGPAQTASNSFIIQVNAVNDAPVLGAPAAQAVAEDNSLIFSAANGNALSVSDVDAGNNNLTVSLGIPAGSLSLASTAGLTVTGDGSGALTLTGNQSAINSALDGLSYQPDTDQNGPINLSLSVTDNGNNGSGSALGDSETISITVNAVNDAPVNSVPGTQNIDEDSTLVFAAVNGNGVSIADVDAGGADINATISVDRGSLVLGSTTGLTVSGNNSASVSVTGTQAAINTALEGMSFTPALNDDADATLTLVTSDAGNTGSGGVLTASDTVVIQVNAINDAPQANNDSATTAEDTASNVDVLSNDTDADGDTLTISQVNGTAVTVGVSVPVANGSVTLQADGSLTYLPSGDFNGPTSFNYTTIDGNGGSAIGTVSLSVTAVNDAPIHVVPGSQSIPEDGALSFSAANGNAIALSDVDAGTADMTVTLDVSQGSLALASTSNLLISGNGSASVSMTGAQADLNAALDGLVFTSEPNQNGTVTLNIVTSDNGNTGSGGSLSASSAIDINIGAVNDAPTQTVPGLQTFNEDSALTFSIANGNAIGIEDIDAGTGNVTTTLSITQGSLTLSSTAGLTVTGNGSNSVSLSGTTTAISTALDGLIYLPDANQTGAASLSVVTNDNGNTGSGPALSANDTIALQINPVNDAPVNTIPGTQNLAEDTALTFSPANGNTISVTDIDAGTGDLNVTVTVGQGSLVLGNTTGLTATGDGTGSVTIAGAESAINTALNGMIYTPAPEASGTVTLSMVTSDNGNTGTGGALITNSSVTLQIGAVNDAPVNSVPGPQTLNEDSSLSFSAVNSNSISVSDVDAGSGSLTATVSVPQGALTLATTANVTVTGNGSGTVTVTGVAADINTALDGLTYTPDLNQNGVVNLSLITSDNGNTGTGGVLTASSLVTLTVTAQNDAPAAVDDSGFTSEDTPTSLAVLGNDSDADGDSLLITEINGSAITSGNSVSVGGATVRLEPDGTLTFGPDSGVTGDVSFTYTVSDGNGGTDSAVATVNIGPVNDAPVNAVPGPQTMSEDSSLSFSIATGNGISVSDSDAGGGNLTVTLSIGQGSLAISSGAGVVANGNNSGLVTLNGAQSNINAVLDTLVYTPDSNQNGIQTLTVLTSDNGNTGSGGTLTASSSISIDVGAVNDAPAQSVPALQTVAEDSALTFSTANGNAISINDIDAGTGNLTTTLSVLEGSLTLGSTTGLTVTGDGSGLVTITGTSASITSSLNGLTYTPNPDQNGVDTLTVSTNDNGNTGSGGALSVSDNIALQIEAVNDAPVNVTPGAQILDEDTTLVFSAANGNAISTSDLDAVSGNLTMILSAPQGSLTLGSVIGISTTGNGTNTVELTGTQANLNAALDGLSYAPDANQNGTFLLSVNTVDNGNTGSGGVLTDSDTISIQVNALNDAPVNSVPATQTIAEDNGLTFSVANANALSVADVDIGTGLLTVTLTVPEGELTLSGTNGLLVSGDGSGSVTVTGNAGDINTALDGLIFNPAPNQNGAIVLTMVSNDNGNTGGPAEIATDSVTIQIDPVNDAPQANTPSAQTVNEDTALVFSGANGNAISVSDTDAGSDSLTATLSVPTGNLSLASTAGLSVGGDGTGAVTLTGSQSAINTALNGLTYQPGSHQNGSLNLSFSVSDNGNNGSGGALTDNETIVIVVNAVNDAPVNTVPPAQTINEDNTLAFSASNGNSISIADIDASSSNITVTLDVDRGSLALGSISGLSVAGNNSGSIVIVGAQADINAALDGLIFTPVTNDNNDATLTLNTNDGGNTGIGGSLNAISTVAIQVSAVNDAPIANVDSAATPEGTPVNLDVRGNDTDADGDPLTVSQINGTPIGIGASVAVSNGDVTLQADGSLTFSPAGDFSGATNFSYTIIDGNGASASGTVNVLVSPVNDAPVNLVPGAQSIPEDGTVTFSSANGNAISLSDVDAGTADLTVTLSVAQGELTLGSTNNLIVSGDGSDTIVMTGAQSALNAALDGLVYGSAPNQNGVVNLTLVTSDNGNTGSGGTQSATSNITINIGAVNDAPEQTLPGLQTFIEDGSLTFSAANGNAISVSDVDAGNNPLTTTLSVPTGTLSLAGNSGLTVTGDGSGNVSLTGSQADINSALDGLSYSPAANQNGAVALSINTNDNGNAGTGGPLSTAGAIAIDVAAVNDAPVNFVPAAQNTPEDIPLVFSGANGNAISVTDLDAGTGLLTVTLNVPQGDLTLGSTTGITATGNGTNTVALTGTAADINLALDGLSYTPLSNQTGTVTLSLLSNDNGNTGSGGPLSTAATVDIQINALNDAPINSVPASQSFNEDTPLTFSSGNGNAITVSDPDAGASNLTTTLSASEGSLTLGSVTGVTVTGNSTSTVTLTGPAANINAALEGLLYAPTGNQNGLATLSVTTTDNGNTGAGGSLTSTDSINLVVNPVNDAPVAVDDTFVTDEDTAINVDVLPNDSDADADVLVVSQVDGTTISTGSSIAVANGSVRLENNGSLTFTPDAHFSGSTAFSYTITDSNGGSDVADVTITVNPINDAPINAVPGNQSLSEDGMLVFSTVNGNAISVADVDAAGNNLTVTLTTGNGSLTVGTAAGVTVSGNNSANVVISGAASDVNGVLDGLAYTPSQHFNGPEVLTISTSDNGNTGAGGPLSDTSTIAIQVDPVNDAPTATDDAASIAEDTSANLFVLSNDTDVEGGPLSVTAINGQTISVGNPVSISNGEVQLEADGSLTFVPDAHFNGTASFTYRVTDPDGAGDNAQATITVTAVADTPVAGNDNRVTAEDTPVSIDALTNDSDADGDVLTITQVNGVAVSSGASVSVANGIVTLESNGTLTFSPAPGFNGLTSFDYTIDDGTGLTDTATVGIDVGAVNDAPIAVNDTASTDEDTIATLMVLTNDSDPDGDPLTITAIDGTPVMSGSVVAVTGGKVTVQANGTLTFTPLAEFAGVAVFDYTIGDDNGAFDTASTTVTVNAVNDAPVNTVPGTQSFAEDNSLTFSVGNGNPISVSDSDAGGSDLTLSLSIAQGDLILASTANLTVTGDGSSNVVLTGSAAAINTALNGLVYTPTPNQHGPQTLSIQTSDNGNTGSGGVLTTTDSVQLQINSVNDAPVAANDTASANEDSSVIINVLANDNDADGDLITVSAIDGTPVQVNETVAVAGGQATLLADGTIRFTPAPDFAGTPSFAYTVSDTNGASASATVAVTVQALNDAPVTSVPVNQSVSEDSPLTFSGANGNAITIGDVDAANSPVTVSLTVPQGTLNPGSTAGLTVSGAGTGNLTLSGSVTDINSALNGLSYSPVANQSGIVRLDILTNDNGNTGSGGALSNNEFVEIQINPVNDQPVNTVPGAQTINENDTLTFSSGNGNALSVSDVDADPGLVTVNLSVSGGSLTASNTAGVTITGNTSNNLSLSGSQTDLNAALDGLSFTPDAGQNGTVSLLMLTSDNGNTGSGGPLTASSSVDILITAINDAPVNTVPGAQTTNEDVALVFSTGLGNAISVNDIDAGTAPLSITVSIGQGDLTLATTSGLTVTGNNTNTVSVTGPQAAINAALDGLSYQPASNANGPQTLTLLTSDNGNTGTGGTLSTTSTVDIQVSAVNDAPTAVDDNFSGVEDTDFGFDVRTNDSDAEGNPIRVATINGTALALGSPVAVANGSVSLLADGSLSFMPAPNFFGPTSFGYTVTDDLGGISGATVNLIIAAINDSPTAANDTATTDEDVSVEVDVRANDQDIEGQPFTITMVDGTPISVGSPVSVTNGTVTLLPNGRLSFNPTPNFNGSSSFTYTIDDGNGGTAQASTTLIVNAVNDAPLANPDTYSTTEDAAITIEVRGNDSDVEGEAINVVSVDATPLTDNTPVSVTNGVVTRLPDGRLVFTPDPDFAGSSNFDYVLQDAAGASASTNVTVNVSNVNDAPVALDDLIITPEDTAVDIQVTTNDSDIDGDALSVTMVDGNPISIGSPVTVSNGLVQLQADGSLRFVPASNYFGSTDFGYTVSDGSGGVASAVTTVTVNPINDMPVANNDTLVTAQDMSFVLDVRSNDSDVESSLLTVIEIDGNPVNIGSVVNIPNGSVTLESDGRLRFSPDAGYQGASSFSYQVADDDGATAMANVAITVTPPNVAPNASDDTYAGSEDTALAFDVRTNDTDPESNPISVIAVDGTNLTVGVAQAVSNGSITLQADGSLIFNPAANFFGSTSFDYTLADSFGATDTATVSLSLANIDDGVTAIDDTLTLTEDTPIAIDPRVNDLDVDGDPLTISEVNGIPISLGSPVAIATGTISLEPDGRLLFTPAPDFNGTGSFTYTLIDGNGSSSVAQVDLNVTPVNDAPVAQNDSISTAEDTGVTIDPRINDSDVDLDAISISTVNGVSIAVGSPVNTSDGQVSLLADGRLNFVPDTNFNGTTSFSYQVSDGSLTSNNALVTVNVSPGNDAPGAMPDSYTGSEDSPLVIDLRDNDIDIDGDTLTVVSINGQALSIGTPVNIIGGQISLQADGSQRFQPDPDFNGPVSFTYEVSDPDGALSSSNATISVLPVNDAPAASADVASTAEDTSVLMDLTANDSDTESDAISIATIDGLPVAIGESISVSNGNVTLVSGSTVSFTPAANFTGSTSFNYTVADQAGAVSNAATASINVTAVNDAPTAINDRFATVEDQAVVFDARLNDTDPEGDTLSVATVEGTALILGSPVPVPNGIVTLQADGQVRFDPAADFNGSTSFIYSVDDGSASSTATITIDVSPVNDAPAGTDDSASGIEDTPVLINVLANDTDPDGEPLQVALINGSPLAIGSPVSVANGIVRLQADGQIQFVPAPDFNGPTSFDYALTDAQGATATATVNLVISAVNDAPQATDDSAVTNEDTPIEVDVTANDTDPEADPVTVYAINGIPVTAGQSVQLDEGTATLLANGNIRFSPARDFNGNVGLIYTVRDSANAQANARISVAILPLNDGPTARDDVYGAVTGATLIIDPRSNDRDPDFPGDGQGVRVTEVNSQPITTGGTITVVGGEVTLLDDGRLQLVSNRQDSEPIAFNYTIADDEGLTDRADVLVQYEAIVLTEESSDRQSHINPPIDRFDTAVANESASDNELYVGRAVRDSQALSQQSDTRQRIDVIEGQTHRFAWDLSEQNQARAGNDRSQFADLRNDRVFSAPGSNLFAQHELTEFNLACWNTDLPQSVLALNRMLNSEAGNQVAGSDRSALERPEQTEKSEPICSPIDSPSGPSGSLVCEPVTQNNPDRFSRFSEQLANASDSHNL